MKHRYQIVLLRIVSAGLLACSAQGASINWRTSLRDLGSQMIYSSIAVSNKDHIFALTDDGKVVSLTSEGGVRWAVIVNPDSDATQGNGLVVTPDRIYASSGKTLSCLDLDGKLLWANAGDATVTQVSLDESGDVLWGRSDVIFSASANGRINWQESIGIVGMGAPAVTCKGDIVITGGDSAVALSKTGEMLWRYSPQPGRWEMNPEVSASVSSKDEVYLASSSGLYCLSAKGVEKWFFPTTGEVQTSAEADVSGNVYFATCEGGGEYAPSHVYCVDGGGKKRWETSISGYLSGTSCVKDGDRLFFATGRKLYELETTDGMIVNELEVGKLIGAAPIKGLDNTIYLGTYYGEVVSMAFQSGDEPGASPTMRTSARSRRQIP